jgi:hypothetical protein
MQDYACQSTADKAKFRKGRSTGRKHKNEGAPENGTRDAPDLVKSEENFVD